jgi:hypothetical protein
MQNDNETKGYARTIQRFKAKVEKCVCRRVFEKNKGFEAAPYRIILKLEATLFTDVHGFEPGRAIDRRLC